MKLEVKNLNINFRLLSMVIILIVMWIFFRIQVGEFYFNGESIAKLSRDMVSWTILAAGVTLVIISGNIDLSVGSFLALIAASCALLINKEGGYGIPTEWAVVIALVIGTFLGFLQGVLTAYFKIPSFIVTLGGLFIFRGITQQLSAFDPRVPDSSWIVQIGIGYIPPFAGWLIGLAAVAVIIFLQLKSRMKKKRMNISEEKLMFFILKIIFISVLIFLFIYKVNAYKGIPNQTLIMFIVLILLYFIAKHTVFGRHIYAIGGNVQAARLSGIKVERKIVTVFALMGLLTGIAGVIWMAQNQGSTKNAGQFYELYAIAAAVIGGTSLMGGKGTILGTFLGGLVMATVIQGMDYSNLDNWLQLVVRGAVLVFAVGIDIATKNPPRWMQRLRFKFQNRGMRETVN
ncbi:MAG: hypothetical protein NTX22_03150 [Ignavibacteriales bacterium]|nr:hypothetical protein [Ignavibacteriales bacterium]